MKRLMLLAALVTFLPACAHRNAVSATQTKNYPFGDPWFPTVRAGAESPTVLPLKYSVHEAFIEPMIDPKDAYAITFHFPLLQSMSQCPILQHWKTVVTVQSQLDATRVYNACGEGGCYCAIFVPDRGTALNYQLALTRFKQGAPPASDSRIQFRIQ